LVKDAPKAISVGRKTRRVDRLANYIAGPRYSNPGQRQSAFSSMARIYAENGSKPARPSDINSQAIGAPSFSPYPDGSDVRLLPITNHQSLSTTRAQHVAPPQTS